MPVLVDGEHLNKFLIPQIIKEIQETEDTFSGFFGKVNKAAVTADGVSVQKLINDITLKTGLSENAKLIGRKLGGKKATIPWMTFTTELITLSAEEKRALAFDKASEVRKMLKQAVMDGMLKHGLHAVAPTGTTGSQVIIETSGGNDGSGRKKMVPADFTSARRLMKGWKNLTLVLNEDHLIDMQEHNEAGNKFKEMGIDTATMNPIPYAGIKTVSTSVPVRYTPAKTKRALADSAAATDKFASVFIDRANTIWYLNEMKIITTALENDNVNEIPKDSFRVYGTFIGSTIEDDRKRAAIIDGTVA